MTFTNQLVQADREQGPARPMTPAEREQDEYKQAQRERVATAVEVGGLCQDLTAYVHLVAHYRLQHDEPGAPSQTSGPRFAPDLLVRLTPEAQLRRTYQKLLKLEPILLTEPPKPGGRKPDELKTTETKADGTNPLNTGGKAPYGVGKTKTSESKPDGARISEAKPDEEANTSEGRPDGARTSEGRSSEAKTTETKPDEPKTTETKPDGARTSEAKPNGMATQRRPGGTATTRRIGGGTKPSVTVTPPRPSRESGIDQKINALLIRSERGGTSSQNYQYPPVNLDDLDDAICTWNERVVELIIDYPVVLAGYRVGKALSFTRWQIQSVDEQWNGVDGNSSADPWDKAFDKQRIDELQRYVNTLSIVLDSRAVTAVSTGMGYWRNALLYLTSLGESSSAQRWSWRNVLRRLASVGEFSTTQVDQPSSSQTIRLWPEQRKQLMVTLEDQVNNWFDVLTERRPPESFPVAGTVASLTKKATANLWARVFRFLIPTVIVLVILGGMLGAASLIWKDGGLWGALQENLTALLGSLGTALAAVFTFLLAPRGPSLFGRGAGPTYGAWGGANGGTPSGGIWRGSYYGGVGAFVNVAANLKQDVLKNVVEQLRLEDINLAINNPLVRCFLSLNGQETGDPQKDAERFLRLIYKDRSNLKQLRPIFKDLYKY